MCVLFFLRMGSHGLVIFTEQFIYRVIQSGLHAETRDIDMNHSLNTKFNTILYQFEMKQKRTMLIWSKYAQLEEKISSQ